MSQVSKRREHCDQLFSVIFSLKKSEEVDELDETEELLPVTLPVLESPFFFLNDNLASSTNLSSTCLNAECFLSNGFVYIFKSLINNSLSQNTCTPFAC